MGDTPTNLVLDMGPTQVDIYENVSVHVYLTDQNNLPIANAELWEFRLHNGVESSQGPFTTNANGEVVFGMQFTANGIYEYHWHYMGDATYAASVSNTIIITVGTGPVDCTTSADCPSCLECVSNQCVPIANCCTDDTQCSIGYTCQGGTCLPDISPPPPCSGLGCIPLPIWIAIGIGVAGIVGLGIYAVKH